LRSLAVPGRHVVFGQLDPSLQPCRKIGVGDERPAATPQPGPLDGVPGAFQKLNCRLVHFRFAVRGQTVVEQHDAALEPINQAPRLGGDTRNNRFLVIGAATILGMITVFVILAIWAERRFIARLQDRLGPNRVGKFGLLQSVADAVKLLGKEIIRPKEADPFLHFLAPMLILGASLMTWAVVPWARAGIGAIATQSYANTTFGPAGLELLAQGYSAQDALNGLLAADEGRKQRQVGVVDGQGGSATFTGEECFAWAGGRAGQQYAAQGNILTGPAVVDRMAETFEAISGLLVDRLLAALAAGQEAGGDSRGQQSAALLVVRPRGGYAGFNDRAVDLRVDDHPAPIEELARLLEMHKLYFFAAAPEDVITIDPALGRALEGREPTFARRRLRKPRVRLGPRVPRRPRGLSLPPRRAGRCAIRASQ